MVNSNVKTDKSVQYVPSNFEIHSFKAEILEKKIVYQVIKMENSLLIYINDLENSQFMDLSLAMNNRYENEAIGTRLIGDFTEEISKNIACRIAKKLQKVVYISYNLGQERFSTPLIEKRLYEEIKNNPDKF